ncbi:MAG: bifunctional oligoribonuclease/PAP phosphatase NrnA [Lachnospiraceae bacterium]|nr:bifunctional oligoribonuclease/PAP phosphatase NrnA [Lachnospiraceae bacterium]
MIDLIKECEGAKKIGISGHVRPDGDAVSSCLALRRYLLNNIPGIEVKVNLEYPPSIFSGIEGYDTIDTTFPDDEQYDVYFALDCNFERLGPAQKYFSAAGKRINIDHHVSNAEGCGDVNEVEPEISSTAELLCKIMDKDKLDKETAMALYVGMVTDTGLFQFSCTSPDTMRRAADLMEYGFDFPRLIKKVFFERTYLQTQIMGRCMMESIRFMDQRCIVGLVDSRTADFYECKPKDYEGIVNQLINIRGVDVAIFMYQTGPMEYKVSMRSTEAVDVAKIAQEFGGGGHVRAAGLTMKGTFHDCVNNLSDKIADQLGL